MGWNFEERLAYPETAEFLEKLVVEDRAANDPGFAGAIDFNFRFHKEKKGEVYVVPGLRVDKRKEFSIETKSGLDFKTGDIIRFENNHDLQFRIVEIDYIIESSDEDEYALATQAWPGMKDNSKIKVLTLK
mgnify:CR=1 FL=1